MLLEQPLADAIYYKHNDVIKLLEKRGAKPLVLSEFVDAYLVDLKLSLLIYECSCLADLGLFGLLILCLLYI